MKSAHSHELSAFAVPVAEFIAESGGTALTPAFWPLMPLSRGHVHINHSDPFQDPIITPRFLTDTFDQDVAVAVARLSRTLFETAPFDGIVTNAYLDPPIGPNGTDAQYLAWFQNTSYGASHWVGSTAMVPRNLGGVVDSDMR